MFPPFFLFPCHLIPTLPSSFYIHLEPGPVQDLTASFDEDLSFNPDTRIHTVEISISWSPPTQPNGEITGYNVTVYRTDNTSDIVYNNTMVTDTTVSPQVMVFPFTDYTVSVSASTSAGEGEATEITIESPEAGKHFFLLPALPSSPPSSSPRLIHVYPLYILYLSITYLRTRSSTKLSCNF